MSQGRQIKEGNRQALEFLRANAGTYTLKEIQAKFPTCSLEALRSHAAYHELRYKKERSRASFASHQDEWIDKEKEARLKSERSSAPPMDRAQSILGKQFDSLERLWGSWVKK